MSYPNQPSYRSVDLDVSLPLFQPIDYNNLIHKPLINGEPIEGNSEILISGKNIKTINGQSILGKGDIPVSSGVDSTYVTPEMFGALGDGVHDDAPAIKAALLSGSPVVLTQDLYCFSMIAIFLQPNDSDTIYLDGRRHTIHFDLGNIMVDEQGNELYDSFSIMVGRQYDETLPLRKVSDPTPHNLAEFLGSPDPREGEPGYSDNYKLGYTSYKGNTPFTGKYAEMMNEEVIEYRYYPEKRVIIENLRFEFLGNRGRYGLKIAYCCNSILRNIESISLDEEGTVGIIGAECYNLLLDNVYAQGWFADYTWNTRGNQGYGIQIPGGDKICIVNSSAWDCKCPMMVGGNRTIWTTNVIVQNFRGGGSVSSDRDIRHSEDGINTTYRWATGLSCHADVLHVIFSNIQIDLPTSYTGRIHAFHIGCPEALIENVTVNCPLGYVVLGRELNEVTYLNGLTAPNLNIMINNAGPGSRTAEVSLVRALYLSNCHIKGLENGATVTKVHMANCEVEETINNINHLTMTNCVVYGKHKTDYPGMIIIQAKQSLVMTACTIYGNHSQYVSTKKPIISTIADNVYMTNCTVLKPSWGVIFAPGQEQTHIVNTNVLNLHGLVFSDPEFGLFDYTELN